MILPDKYVPAATSTIGMAATLLPMREAEQTVSHLWSLFTGVSPNATFDRFAESLTLLHLMGVVEMDRGLLRWTI